MTKRTNKNSRECLYQIREIHAGKSGFCAYSVETFIRLASEGFLTWTEGSSTVDAKSYTLTTAGENEAETFAQERDKRNKNARVARKARESTLRDLGLTKTRNGWE